MANETTTPAPVADTRDAQILELTARVVDLEAKFTAEAETHAFQAKRADEAERELAKVTKAYDKRLEDVKAELALARKKAAPVLPEGDVVILDGVVHKVLITVRADNTFAEVKRGHVHEGCTMAVIAKHH